MRRFISILFLFLACSFAQAADEIVTLTVTVTNLPVDTDTITVNSDTRTWKDTVTTPSTEVATAVDGQTATTNLFEHAATHTFTTLRPSWNATNEFRLTGLVNQTITASETGGWATLTLSTQTLVNLSVVRVPLSGEPTAASRTNIASHLVTGMSDYATNSFSDTATALANYVSLDESQVLSNKTLVSPIFTNAVNRGNALSSPGTASGSEQFGTGATATKGFSFAAGNNANADSTSGVAVGQNSAATGLAGDTAVGQSATASGTGATAVGFDTDATAESSSAFGEKAQATHKHATAIGYQVSTTATNQVRLGQASGSVSIPGTLDVAGNVTFSTDLILNGNLTNATYYGTIGNITNGTWYTAGFVDATNSGNAFESPGSGGADSLQIGQSANAANASSISVGNASSVTADDGTAVGDSATVTHATSTALGSGSTTTASNQIRLGTASEHVSAPGNVNLAGNLHVGTDTNSFVGGITQAIQIDDGAAASADPSSGSALWSAAGELQYRTSGADEGSGGTQRLHNRADEVICSGSNYPFTTAYALVDFGGVDPDINPLPSAGTYLIITHVSITAGATANDTFQFKLRNITDAADVANSEVTYGTIDASGTSGREFSKLVTVDSADRIQLFGRNTDANRGSVIATETRMTYVRLF